VTQETGRLGFNGLVDLASAALGGEALATSDDFFAGMQSLLLPEPAVFVPGKYTERGKWMDGWESRRKRGPGHDWCLVRLGVPGIISALDIDTSHFNGNHPAFASVEAVSVDPETPTSELLQLGFRQLVAQSPLLPTSRNLFVTEPLGVVSHVRLNIFPDGGVARLRCYGRVAPGQRESALDEETARRLTAPALDLAALENGALALACSDAHFGGMNNLLLPGRALDMGSGWETRRRRGAGHDWIVIRLGARGTPRLLEIDTNHFKGNFPDRCALDVIDAPDSRPTDLLTSEAWRPLLPETPLAAHTRHFYQQELLTPSPATHVRLRIFPDGGVSRLRVWGARDD
jgi:allantoicase